MKRRDFIKLSAGHEIARHAPRPSNAVHRSALFSSCNRDKTVSDTARIRLPVRRVRRRIRFAPCADRLQSDSCDSICAVKPLCRKACRHFSDLQDLRRYDP